MAYLLKTGLDLLLFIFQSDLLCSLQSGTDAPQRFSVRLAFKTNPYLADGVHRISPPTASPFRVLLFSEIIYL